MHSHQHRYRRGNSPVTGSAADLLSVPASVRVSNLRGVRNAYATDGGFFVAVRGQKPAGPGVSNNRNAPIHDWTEVEDVPFEGGPDLPEFRPDGRPWPDATRAKWDTWRSMPHAKLWGAGGVELRDRHGIDRGASSRLRVRRGSRRSSATASGCWGRLPSIGGIFVSATSSPGPITRFRRG